MIYHISFDYITLIFVLIVWVGPIFSLVNKVPHSTIPIQHTRTLLIDNYDSYTYNIYHLLAESNGVEPYVINNDAYSSYQSIIRAFPDIDNIVISPGPGNPDRKADFGVCTDVILESTLPVLGVCLGHQGIAAAYGGKVSLALQPMHGRISKISHLGDGIFKSIPQDFNAVRYHSLIADAITLASCLRATAWTPDGQIMGLQHTCKPIYGVQFHPESISTEHGSTILKNFRDLTLLSRRGQTRPTRFSQSSLQPIRRHISPAAGLTNSRVNPSTLFITRLQIPPSMTAADIFRDMYGSSNVSFWLDSATALKSASGDASLSFMGAVDSSDGHIVEYMGRGVVAERHYGQPAKIINKSIFQYMRDKIQDSIPPLILRDEGCIGTMEKLPFATQETWFGYIGYEGRHDAEAITAAPRKSDGHFDYAVRSNKLKQSNANESQPVAVLMLPSTYLVFDHLAHMIYVVALSFTSSASKYNALKTKQQLNTLIQQYVKSSSGVAPDIYSSFLGKVKLSAHKSESDYRRDIEKCLEQITFGETYEVCLTVQFTGRLDEISNPLELYEILRRRNPAPYASYIRYEPDPNNFPSYNGAWSKPGGIAVMSSSPERYLKAVNGKHIESKPIKGTARRDKKDRGNDAYIAANLREDEKSRAENLMIVDLVRNDFGRVCEVGSVKVPSLMEVESYTSVHQLVSTITGTLQSSFNVADAIVATFPGGSMTGAPKLRTMEIIDSIEERPRGIYSGAIGYISKNNIMDLSIVIRTAVLSGSELTVSSGGAIVAMSNPTHEVEEVLLKAHTVASAIDCNISFKESAVDILNLNEHNITLN